MNSLQREYLPIITRTTTKTFFEYINTVDIPQIDYFAIGIQNTLTSQSTSLMSLTEWQKHFIDNNYANYDPIRRVTLHTNRKIIPFDEVDFVDNFGKEIMRQRAKMGISNGIIFMERFKKFNYMITFGTGYSNFDSFNFIKRYHDKIFFIKNDLIKIVEKEARSFIPVDNK
ncbi:autoinducer binding domain-containing protein [Legionella jamestowniensis]|uniref:Autoinducer binding domain protein n=1 Tax=Legionella jamestowniensis TaxID=455 RepID=A0A0W0UKU4_9GAMM|nr:autoinducer binding domain-containing protein [Legionella jamestowniensis]KTD08530.1 Autoinducer binding domain protein [Legionella jamestowniensis]SFL52466.1 Autoinducer binding domain-containing protein [Legionella jamestowniensis DSM 19215]